MLCDSDNTLIQCGTRTGDRIHLRHNMGKSRQSLEYTVIAYVIPHAEFDPSQSEPRCADNCVHRKAILSVFCSLRTAKHPHPGQGIVLLHM